MTDQCLDFGQFFEVSLTFTVDAVVADEIMPLSIRIGFDHFSGVLIVLNPSL